MTKSNYIYLYKDTFLSLLNLIQILIKEQIIPKNIKPTSYQPSLFETTFLKEIPEKTSTLNNIISFYGKNIFTTIYYVFLSTDDNKELIIYYFLIYASKYKNKIYYMRNLKCVDKALKITKYVSNENHKLKGFVRFKELNNNVLYAEIEPVNNILFILSNHFAKRLKNEYWIIKDVKRNILSIYDKKTYQLISSDDFIFQSNDLSSNEKEIEKLWKQFYQTIAIKERKNDRCRMTFMPKKYWKYIIEMSDEYEKSNN